MYFPYLRARQNEIFAVREAVPAIAQRRKVRPILEPVRQGQPVTQLLTCAQALENNGLPYLLVENPTVGHYRNLPPATLRNEAMLPACGMGTSCIPAFIVGAGTTLAAVSAFLNRYANRPVALIHETSFQNGAGLVGLVQAAGNVQHHIFRQPGTSTAYQHLFPGLNAVLTDVVSTRANNAAYANPPVMEHFTSEHLHFQQNGFGGFSDYGTIGRAHREDDGGGGTRAVAIHLTYPDVNDVVWIRHFVSDDQISVGRVSQKSLEAAQHLVAFAQGTPSIQCSSAVADWQQSVAAQHGRGLGVLKRWSMRHHMELMDRLVP